MAPRSPMIAAMAELQVNQESLQDQIDAIARLAGVDLGPIKTKAGLRIARLRRQADVDNPAQPVPEPAAEAPAVTTEEARRPDGTADVEQIGATPVADVAADATTSVTSPEPVLMPEALPQNDQNVEAPVAGTQQVIDSKQESVPETGSGDSTSTMFPLTGPFASPATAGREDRTFAAMRLARMRIAANIAEGDDLVLGSAIARSNVSDAEIAAEIRTLAAVLQNNAPTAAARPTRHLVPRSASAERGVPSMAPTEGPRAEGMGFDLSIPDDHVGFE